MRFLVVAPTLLGLVLAARMAGPAPGPGALVEEPSIPEYRLDPAPEDVAGHYGRERVPLLEKLNRADRDHLVLLDTLVVPERWDEPELSHSPLPDTLPGPEVDGRVLVVHAPFQVFGAYEEGRLKRWGPVSSGRREYPTPSGLFHLTWRDPGRYSTVEPDFFMEWYFNFHERRGLAFHKGPLPGRPASRACVRLLERDARWLYSWGEGWVLDEKGDVDERGTPVRILGAYDFDAPPPWLDPRDPHADVAHPAFGADTAGAGQGGELLPAAGPGACRSRAPER